jgi:hypothetical protein
MGGKAVVTGPLLAKKRGKAIASRHIDTDAGPVTAMDAGFCALVRCGREGLGPVLEEDKFRTGSDINVLSAAFRGAA